MLNASVPHYHQTLLRHEKAQQYLRGRGLHHVEAIEHFQIGYNDRTFLKTLLPGSRSRAQRRLRKELQEQGHLDAFGKDVLGWCLTVPIFDEAGEPVQLYCRRISKPKEQKKPHVWATQNHEHLWNWNGIHGADLILTKGILDALSIWLAGYQNVTSLNQPQRLSAAQIERFRAKGIQRITLAFGNTPENIRQYQQIGAELQAAGFLVFRTMFPRGHDPNAYAQKYPLKNVLDLAERDDLQGVSHDETEQHAGHDISYYYVPTESEDELNTKPAPEAPQNHSENAEPERSESAIENLQIKDEDIFGERDHRRYRIRGFFQNTSVDALKITVRLEVAGTLFVDSFDLYVNRQRKRFVVQASLETGVPEATLQRDLVEWILELERLQDGYVEGLLKPEQMSEEEKAAALKFLQSPDLIDRILRDLETAGVVGEEQNKLAGYLAMVSRKLEKPLAILIQSTSAAGKSSLLEALLQFVPPEDQHFFSSLTPQSLYYMAEQGIRHKVLAIAESEGALNAGYSLKLLQSEGKLSINTAGGHKKGLRSQRYGVEGPVMMAFTTTSIEIDEELLNRCLVLTVDESRAQTKAIHAQQRFLRTLEGLTAAQKFEERQQLHHNAQRLLEPMKIINPFAPFLTFHDERTRLRRDHLKYLTLIEAVTFLHQHQRENKRADVNGKSFRYIETTVEDIRLANQLAHDLLGTTLDDLPPQTRRLLDLIWEFVRKGAAARQIEATAFRFPRKELREYCQWGDTQLKVHLKRLVDQEYLLCHVVNRRHYYECLYQGEGDDRERFVMGLKECDTLLDRLKREQESAAVA